MAFTRHKHRITEAVFRGLTSGWKGFLWLLKILLPVSFFAFFVHATGLLAKAEFLLGPVMNLLHLPANAAVPILMGICTGTAGTVAAMTAIPFTHDQMTLIAVFSLISHNMIQEGIVQAKTGSSFIRSLSIRLTASVLTVWVVSTLFFSDGPNISADVAAQVHTTPLGHLFLGWLKNTAGLTATLFLIIMSMMVILELMKAYSWIDRLNTISRPVLKLLGLDTEIGVFWLTTTFFGLAYGGTMIVQELRKQSFSDQVLQRFHISAGINHSIVEEPAMFLPLGIHPVMLWIPRLVVAALAVHLYRIISSRRPPGIRPCNRPD